MKRKILLESLTTLCLAGALVGGVSGTASAERMPALDLSGGAHHTRSTCTEWSNSCPWMPGGDPTGPNVTSDEVCGVHLAKDADGNEWNVDTCSTFTTDWHNGDVEVH
jgi:hypothetical protein